MAGRLTARKVTTAKAGKYSDGNNLYLVVSRSGSRKWVLRFTWRGQAKEMGLGKRVERAAVEREGKGGGGCASPGGRTKPHRRAQAYRRHPHLR